MPLTERERGSGVRLCGESLPGRLSRHAEGERDLIPGPTLRSGYLHRLAQTRLVRDDGIRAVLNSFAFDAARLPLRSLR